MPVPKALLQPVQGTFTSLFGVPRNNNAGFHTGLDIAPPKGTGAPVRAAYDGVVQIARDGFANEYGRTPDSPGGYGNQVWLKHDGFGTVYAHFQKVLVRRNQKLTRGQQIGTVGNTGISTGPHLHFEVRDSERPQSPCVDPLTCIASQEDIMIRKNAIAKRFDNKAFDGEKGVELDIRTDFGLPDRARCVRIEVFMKSGGVVVRDGAKKNYAGQVKEKWGQKRDVIDVFPKSGVFYLNFDRGTEVALIGCLGYFD